MRGRGGGLGKKREVAHGAGMPRFTVETAVREGIPFVISMADGMDYTVREQFQIALGTPKPAAPKSCRWVVRGR